jgi:para-nitrobenzyl esterase
MRFVLSVLLACSLAMVAGAGADPVVAVTGGQVRGALLEKGGAVFKGVPFAEPPVGDLRWREPMPVKPWTGVRDATAFHANCVQNPYFVRYAPDTSKEDCLYLNIWTPEWPGAPRKPVMVWIPGGGNFAGGSSIDRVDGEALARHGVVLVTINYRLGLFGFLAHPELTKESPHHASGNYGFLDQIAALKWVRDNIATFGGDPGQVTIFGESAGSFDVSVLMTSPLSKGLFHRAIGESGAVILVGDPFTLVQGEKQGESFAARVKGSGSAPARLTALRALSVAQILKAEPNYLESPLRNLGVTVDGYVFPKRPADVFAAGAEHRVPQILGNNSRERIPGSNLSTDLAETIQETYGALASRAATLYGTATDPLYGTPAEQWAGDTSFRCSAVAQLLWHASAGNTAYEYQFDRAAPGREANGAVHGADVEYVFGTLAKPPEGTFNDVDRMISEAMQEYWTNFAKTGDPNGGQLPRWPKFDPAARAYLEFRDSGAFSGQGLRRPFCDVYIENVKRLMER